MDGKLQFSTDDATWVDIAELRQYHYKGGDSGHAYHRNHSVSAIHKFITNSTGGDYYFRAYTGGTSGWRLHDMKVVVIENVSDFNGVSYTQT